MACDITKGKTDLACKNAVSGLKAIYVANYDDYGFVVTSDDVGGHVLTDLGTLATGDVFKYALKNTGNTYQEEIQSNRDNGTTFFNQVLNFILTKISKDMHFQIKMLAWGRPIIFVENNSGDFFVIGMRNGCEISGTNGVGGTLDSLNGYTLVATGQERAPAYFLTSAAITALQAAVAGQPEVPEPIDPEIP